MCPETITNCIPEGTADPVLLHASSVHLFTPLVGIIIIPMIIFGILLIVYLTQRAIDD